MRTYNYNDLYIMGPQFLVHPGPPKSQDRPCSHVASCTYPALPRRPRHHGSFFLSTKEGIQGPSSSSYTAAIAAPK